VPEIWSSLAGQGSAALDAQGVEAIPSTSGQVLGAAFDEGLAHNLGPGLFRSADYFRTQTGVLGVDEYGRPIMGEPEALLDPETANRDYGIKGVLSFDTPVAASVAQDLNARKHAEIERQDIIQRRETGLLTGGAARFSANLAAGLLDPLGLAVGFIPVVGEAREALWLARATEAAGMAGRAAVRFGTGAAGGALGMAALTPLEAGLSRQEHEDFTAADALRNIAIGGLFGGGLHAVGGAIADRVTGRYANPLTQRLDEAGPEARAALLQGAISQHLDDRPVNVAAALDGLDAERAERELLQWVGVQERIDRRAEAALADITASETRTAARRTALAETGEVRLAELQRQAVEVRAEHERALREADAAVDPVTQERLGQIEAELSRPIAAARRADLEAEQSMLREGARTTPAGDALERARSLAQAEGLARDLGRTERQSAAVEQQLTRRQAELASGETAAQRAFDIATTRLDSQQRTLQDLTERTIRRIARQGGVAMSDEEISAAAYRLLRAPAGEVRPEVARVLGRRPGETAPPAPKDLRATLQPDLKTLQQQKLQAAREVAHPPPEPAHPAQAAADEASRAPVETLDDVTRDNAALEQEMGIATPEAARPAAPTAPAQALSDPAVAAAREAGARALAEGEARASAFERAAACLLRGG
jgi:hypothetical protein